MLSLDWSYWVLMIYMWKSITFCWRIIIPESLYSYRYRNINKLSCSVLNSQWLKPIVIQQSRCEVEIPGISKMVISNAGKAYISLSLYILYYGRNEKHMQKLSAVCAEQSRASCFEGSGWVQENQSFITRKTKRKTIRRSKTVQLKIQLLAKQTVWSLSRI